jgi:hypothetical protein
LLAASALISWIIVGVKAHKYGASKGLGYFFMHLLSAVLVVFVLWLTIVYPSLD